jgi:hypothetical protein
VIEAVQAVQHPAGQFIIDLVLGRHRSPWEAV